MSCLQEAQKTAVGHKFDISKTNIHFWSNDYNSIFSYKAKTK